MTKISARLVLTAMVFTPGLAQATQSYPLAELDSAALVLRHAFDGNKKVGCGLDEQKAGALLQVLEARLDAKKTEFAKPSEAAQKNLIAELKDCDSNCHCGVLSDVVQGFTALDKSGQEALTHAQAKAKAQSPAKSLKCAQKARWVCSSGLLKALQADAKDMGTGSTTDP